MKNSLFKRINVLWLSASILIGLPPFLQNRQAGLYEGNDTKPNKQQHSKKTIKKHFNQQNQRPGNLYERN